MERYLETLKRTKLFENFKADDLKHLLNCLNASVKHFKEDETVFFEGQEAEFVGILLFGGLEIQKIDIGGNANMISRLYPLDVIGATAVYSKEGRLPFDVVCNSDCEILCLNSKNLIKQCSVACSFHAKLIENLLQIVADKNLQLTNKIDILTKRTIREKILAFLYAQSKRTKNKKFSVPLSRLNMANYLSINRSAMIRELCNMKKEGIIDFDKNIFWLKL